MLAEVCHHVASSPDLYARLRVTRPVNTAFPLCTARRNGGFIHPRIRRSIRKGCETFKDHDYRAKLFGWWRNSPLNTTNTHTENDTQQPGTSEPEPATEATQEPSAEAAPEPVSSPFAWHKYWYPVAIERDLCRDKPNAITLLGKQLVIWQNAQGSWEAVEDRCPHRLAQLSEGRVESGELVCSYHGWRFGAQGQLLKIPTAEGGGGRQSGPLCAIPYPAQVCDGLVWVWPESGPIGFAESISKSPITADQVQPGTWHPAMNWLMSEFSNSYGSWLEQAFDPAHAPHLHAGVFKFKPEESVPLQIKMQGPIQPEGFSVTHGAYMASQGNMAATRTFTAPTTSTFVYTYDNGRQELTVVHYAPVSPFKVRTFFKVLSAKPQSMMPAFLRIPAGIQHVFIDIADQDSVIMGSQERIMADGKLSWRDYNLATAADRGVGAIREWLSKYGSIPYEGAESARPPSREDNMDQYARHTRYCPDCKKAAKLLGVAAIGWATVAALSLVSAVAARKLVSWSTLLSVVGSLASIACASYRTRYFNRGSVRWEHPQGSGKFITLLERVLVVVVGLGNALLHLFRRHALEPAAPVGAALLRLPSEVLNADNTQQMIQRLQSGVGELVENRQEIISQLQTRAAEVQKGISDNSAQLMNQLQQSLGSTQQDVLQAVREKLPVLDKREEFKAALREALSSFGSVDEALAAVRSRLPPLDKPDDLLELIRSKLGQGSTKEDAQKVLDDAVQVVELEAAGKVVEGVQKDVEVGKKMDNNSNNGNGSMNGKMGENGKPKLM